MFNNLHIKMIHDLVDPSDPQGRTWKQINAELQHGIAVGSLVEIVGSGGVRLFVVSQGRDCDMTPLYWLCHDPDATDPYDYNLSWIGGYAESSLKVIRGSTS